MTPWPMQRLAPFDLETTGPDPFNDHIVTAYLGGVSGGRDTTARSWLIAPDKPISDGAAAVHGITNEHAREHGTDPTVALEEIADAITRALTHYDPCALVGWNVAFDLTVLERDLARNDLRSLTDRLVGRVAPIIDGFVLDKQHDRYRRGKRTLTAACQHYGIQLDEADAHTAGGDALAATRVVWKIARAYPQLAEMTLDELHAAQIEWAAEQQQSLAAYFRGPKSTNKEARVERGWPIFDGSKW